MVWPRCEQVEPAVLAVMVFSRNVTLVRNAAAEVSQEVCFTELLHMLAAQAMGGTNVLATGMTLMRSTGCSPKRVRHNSSMCVYHSYSDISSGAVALLPNTAVRVEVAMQAAMY